MEMECPQMAMLTFLLILPITCLAGMQIIDPYGNVIDAFNTIDATNIAESIQGYIALANHEDACTVLVPSNLPSNSTMKKFVLINGTSECSFMTKVRNAAAAGYDIAVLYNPFVTPFEYHNITFPLPDTEVHLTVVLVLCEDGEMIRDNYLFNNHRKEGNYVVKIHPHYNLVVDIFLLWGWIIVPAMLGCTYCFLNALIECIQEKRQNRRNRLSSRQIRKIPTAKFTKGDQYDVCVICLEDYKEGDKLRILPCSHAYHSKCIDPWLMNNRRNCPLCKRKITFRFFSSAAESESEGTELTSPSENTPLLNSPSYHGPSRGTFVVSVRNPNDGSGPSSMPTVSPREVLTSENPFLSADESESLLPPPVHSINQGTDNTAVVFSEESIDDIVNDQGSSSGRC